MSDFLQLVQDADWALLKVEQAKTAVELARINWEAAKSDLDAAKTEFDSVIARAEEVGVQRSKLRKIVEERVAVLSASGLLTAPVNKTANVKNTKVEKKSTKGKASKASADNSSVANENHTPSEQGEGLPQEGEAELNTQESGYKENLGSSAMVQ